MSSSAATDGGHGGLVSAMASEASSSSSNEHSERQVKFADVPTNPTSTSSSSHCNSNGPGGASKETKAKGGMSKVFQRSCSSAGVLGSLSKQQSFTATCKTTTEKDEKQSSTGLANIPEDKVSLFAYSRLPI